MRVEVEGTTKSSIPKAKPVRFAQMEMAEPVELAKKARGRMEVWSR